MEHTDTEHYANANALNRGTTDMSSATEFHHAVTQTIEMQENPGPNAPPVYANQNVITAQPQVGEVQHSRRPIPISTLDWISTPRSQISALSGTHFLVGVEQLEVQQVVDLSTLLGRTERGSQYRVKIPKAETLFLAIESTPEQRPNGLSCSRFTRKDFTLNVLDQSGETSFVMKINSKWSYTLSKLHKITVGSANLIGTVEENFSVVGPCFTIYDDARKEIGTIAGPNVCGCCMYKEAQFQVVSADGTRQIASLMHQWDNTSLDYTLLVTFPIDTDTKLKSLLLGAAFLVEYLYFERIRRTSKRS